MMRRTAILLLAAMGAALVLSSGVAIAAINTIQCKTNVDCYGTKNPDRLLGTDGSNSMHGKDRGDTLKGFGSNDYLYGQKGADKLYGGTDSTGNSFTGGSGGDTMVGSAGDDLYEYNANDWGKDTITDTTISDNDFNTGNAVRFVSPGETNINVLTTDLTINLTSRMGPEIKNETATSTINWSAKAIDNIYNFSSGDDTITANDATNGIFSLDGFDKVYGLGGDDYIVVDDGGADVVDCGAGTDTVFYDGPDPGPPSTRGDTLTDCEALNPR